MNRPLPEIEYMWYWYQLLYYSGTSVIKNQAILYKHWFEKARFL